MATPAQLQQARLAPHGALELLTVDSSHKSVASARKLLLEYGHFVAAQPGVASFCLGALEAEAASLPQSYLSQQGGALLAVSGEVAIGFVAWRTLPHLPDAYELKRLWIRPQARGLGVGVVLVEAVEQQALKAGKSAIVLDTAPDAMAGAYQLYLRMGFAPCPSYTGTSMPGIVYMRKFLKGQ